MNKLILSLAAIAALSTASLASERGYDLRDSDTYTGRYATNAQKPATSSKVTVNAFAVSGSKTGLTAFERVTQTSIENENSGH